MKLIKFQSLLWWICHFDLQHLEMTITLSGFNPCYDGFVILTIFMPPFSIHFGSFNPCYDGFVILTYIFQVFTYFDFLVSILVMMDLSFWQEIIAELKRRSEEVSILVMMDLSFWRVTIPFNMRVRNGFNPCYDGFVILTEYIGRSAYYK